MRVEQPSGTRGSLKWLQLAVANRPDLLQPSTVGPIHWRSPLAEDGFAEYRDAAFLEHLQLGHLSGELRTFWPARGPQWDALGLTADGCPVLVEAKAHLAEFLSPPTQAGVRARGQIDAAFATVRADLGVTGGADWAQSFYQYANRLAHLWWFHRQGIEAELVFVSFLNDTDMRGPATAEAWEAAFAVADYALGLPRRHKLTRRIHHLTPDVAALM